MMFCYGNKPLRKGIKPNSQAYDGNSKTANTEGELLWMQCIHITYTKTYNSAREEKSTWAW